MCLKMSISPGLIFGILRYSFFIQIGCHGKFQVDREAEENRRGWKGCRQSEDTQS